MVFLRVNMANNALDVNFFPLRIVGNAADIADVSKAVRFDVGFRHHKQAIDITQFVKTWIVRVVSGTHGVDVDAADIADVSKAVRFDVGFRHHKQAIDITQFVKTWIVRVVSGTHGVDVVLLHQLEIFLDAIHPNGAAFAMIVVVAVDAVQHRAASHNGY